MKLLIPQLVAVSFCAPTPKRDHILEFEGDGIREELAQFTVTTMVPLESKLQMPRALLTTIFVSMPKEILEV